METILIVEDDRVYARTTANWLVKNGINARYVLSVDAAKVFLEGHEADLVLSDFRLNDSNGVELLEWMKTQGYRMPFLIMTGYGDIPGAVEAVKKGAADYLPKPVQTEKDHCTKTRSVRQSFSYILHFLRITRSVSLSQPYMLRSVPPPVSAFCLHTEARSSPVPHR